MEKHDITQPFTLRMLLYSKAKKFKEHCGLIKGLISKGDATPKYILLHVGSGPD